MISKKIGSGSFGDIFLGKNVSTNQDIAIKLEKKDKGHSQLQ